jgi:rhamnose transport system ATP-binding protein
VPAGGPGLGHDGASSGSAAAPVLAVVDVSKRFGSTDALRDVSLAVSSGEVLAVVGENGAGKSTLIKIATGLHHPDTGHLEVDGRRVDVRGPAHAQALGIACIHQEPLVFPDLSVAENVFMGHADARGRVRWRELHDRTAKILDELEVDIDPRSPASQLTVGGQQAVSIAKAMSRDVRVLIMDEPTAALSAHEVQRLFRQVRRLSASGVAIVFVSHRLDEVFELSDRITVLRDGRHISTRPTPEVTEASLIRDMVGRELDEFFHRVPHEPGAVALEVEGLGRSDIFDGVSFSVRAGEVLGFAGLVGSGRTEVAEAVFGVAPADRGVIRRDGEVVTIRSPHDAMARGIAYVSEDRRRFGLSLPQSVTANITFAGLRRFTSRWHLVDRDAERRTADRFRTRLGIRTASLHTPVGDLSGGNQQKVMLARWLDVQPSVLVLDEPTRGIDVGAKADVHELVGELARGGVAVILISSDLPEVLALSDRVLVMREGRQVGVFADADLEQERIMMAAVGVA